MKSLKMLIIATFLLPIILTKLAEGGGGNSINDQSSLSKELAFARGHNKGFINARVVADENGNQSRNLEEGFWQYNVLGKTDTPRASLNQGILNGTQFIVVFVHGFDNTPLRALKNGNILWKWLMISDSKLFKANITNSNNSIAFFTFLWRSDYGQLKFPTAQKAADITSKSFSNFIEELNALAPTAKIVVITHSLGTQVALQALRDSCSHAFNKKQRFDSLILIQGAISALSIYQWEESEDIYWIFPQMREHHTKKLTSGKFADGLKCVGQLIYTYSDEDSTLRRWYKLGAAVFRKNMPKMTTMTSASADTWDNIPLGLPFDSADKFTFLSSQSLVGNRLFTDETKPKPGNLRDHIIIPTVMLNYKNININHGNVEGIDLKKMNGYRKDITDWHSPIFEEEGFYILDYIWKKVVQEFKN